MKLRAVLFDYGGTLDGPASHWLDRFVELYREAGIEVPFERLKDAFYAADRAAYAEARMRSASLGELMRFHVGVQLARLAIDDAALRRALVERFVDRSHAALAASRAVLAELAGDFALGVVSNFYGNVEHILRQAGFGPLLRVVADSTVVGAAKPDAAIFRHAVTRLGTAAEDTLHVGDSWERDVLGARAAGLRAVWLVDDDRQRPRHLPDSADGRIASLAALPPWLRTTNGIDP